MYVHSQKAQVSSYLGSTGTEEASDGRRLANPCSVLDLPNCEP